MVRNGQEEQRVDTNHGHHHHSHHSRRRRVYEQLGRSARRTRSRALRLWNRWRPKRRFEPIDPKRLVDLTLGTALMVPAAPLLAVTALVLALSRRNGGVLVREYRCGRHGHPFIMRSLRTRRLRLDLLSRLPHVVRGDLSLVGPAPLPLGGARAAEPWRQLVRPGLTGLAQVRGRSRLPWDEAALLDQHYVEHHWIGMDLAILAGTLPAVHLAHIRPAVLRAVAALRRARTGALSDTDHRQRRYIAARQVGTLSTERLSYRLVRPVVRR
jgi:lipopolysaccharide/colanic/teichoic acid biosynthesis glycosyltransferase